MPQEIAQQTHPSYSTLTRLTGVSEETIPVLPCRTIQPVLDFYTALGFEVTFQQQSPNPYGVVERGGIQLHFLGMERYEPAESYSTCYIQTDDVDGLHAAFRAGLKTAYGRVPTRGLPRIGALKDTSYGVRQFLVTDPGGNCLRSRQARTPATGLHPRKLSPEPFITRPFSRTRGTIRPGRRRPSTECCV